jgi:hypothetical protein
MNVTLAISRCASDQLRNVTRPPYAGDAEYLGVCEERGFSGSERKSPYRRKICGPWRAQFCSELAEGVSV